MPIPFLRASRSWPEDQWDAATEDLRARGLVTGDDVLSLTDAGRAHRDWVEDRTDAASVPAYAALGEDGCARVRELARPFSRAVIEGGLLPG